MEEDYLVNSSTWNPNASMVDNIYKGWDFDADGNLTENTVSPSLTELGTSSVPTNTDFDWLNKDNLGLAGQGLGLIGGLANMYSNMWGKGAELTDTQIGLLKDKRAYNQELMANKREFNKNFGEGLAGAFAQG